MAVVVTQYHDPIGEDGLGKSSKLGVGFLRKVNVDLNSAGTTATIVPADLGCMKFYNVESIVPKTAHTWHVSAFSESSLTLTGSDSAAVADVFIMVAGL